MRKKILSQQKGFTLIELLAVIIVLAIIALISVPTVLDIINGARKSAAENSVYGIIKAAELYYAKELLKQEEFGGVQFTATGTALISGVEGEDLEFKGTQPTYGTVMIDSTGKIIIYNLKINGFTCNMDFNDKAVCY